MKNTIIVNLFAGPGVGKSTTMGGVFTKLKHAGVDCEMALEYAKELVWDERHDLLADQQHIYEEQLKRLKRLIGKVDVIVTDGPIALTVVYDQLYNRGNHSLVGDVLKEHHSHNTFNYFLKRVKPYNPNGRYQTADEAKQVDPMVKNVLVHSNIPHTSLEGTPNAIDKITEDILMVLHQ